jgi:hypothetical protein
MSVSRALQAQGRRQRGLAQVRMSLTRGRMAWPIVFSVATLLNAPDCLAADRLVGEYRCSSLTSYFYGESMQTRIARFAVADLEKQYAIYICGNQFREPPAMYFAGPFAQEGGRAVDFLKPKLDKASEDATIRDIIHVFAEMKRQDTYEVAQDAALMQVIQASVGRIRDRFWKRFVEREVSRISEPSR